MNRKALENFMSCHYLIYGLSMNIAMNGLISIKSTKQFIKCLILWFNMYQYLKALSNYLLIVLTTDY